jgi:hypothetical protein
VANPVLFTIYGSGEQPLWNTRLIATVTLIAPQNNYASVFLRGPDSLTAELPPNTQVRLEHVNLADIWLLADGGLSLTVVGQAG